MGVAACRQPLSDRYLDRQTTLHVTRSPPVNGSIVDHSGERVETPAVGIVDRDCVEVAV